MILYRISSPEYAKKLDGKGAEKYGGRWNTPGTPAVYAASDIALSFGEKLVHLDPEDMPDDLMLAEIYLAVHPVVPSGLPKHWDQLNPPMSVARWGDGQLANHVAIEVPSVVILGGRNIIISPRHKNFKEENVRILQVKPFPVDERIKKLFGKSKLR